MNTGKEKIMYTDHKVSMIILTYNQLSYTKLCIESIRKHTAEINYEIIIVDNNSADGTVEWLKKQNDIKTIFEKENVGFPKGCNDGIKIADGDSILLINNDVIVTKNWLKNMLIALYSSSDIGACGAVSNACTNYQTIPVNYKSKEELFSFAEKNNISDPSRWKEKSRLIGFCMIIKREVIEKIGLLDKRFTPGNFEDDDYSYRIRLAGYRLILCNDVFIHHFGSVSFGSDGQKFKHILDENRKKFISKWGFNPEHAAVIRRDIIDFMDDDNDLPIKVLEIGCKTGATLIEIKNKYKNAELYGIELNKKAAKISGTVCSVKSRNIETDNTDYDKNYFDYIIFGDEVQHFYNPWKVLSDARKYLKTGGKVLASIYNVMHYSVLKSLINGRWNYGETGIIDKMNLRFFTLAEINKMFIDAGYFNMQYAAGILPQNDDKIFADSISKLSDSSVKDEFNVYKYIVKAHKNKKFVTMFPETENFHLTKDVGMIPYMMYKYFGYDSEIVCYKNGEYPYLNNEVKGLKIKYILKSKDSIVDGIDYLNKNGRNIDVLHLFHLSDRTLNWIAAYKSVNPRGKVYLKLDANISITEPVLNEYSINVLKMCDLISVETKYLYRYLNKNWPLKIEYIPNGFYDYESKNYVQYSQKENVICTVGRIGEPIKANQILMEAFRLAFSKISGWKLKMIGNVNENFKVYVQNFMKKNPELHDKIIFTGEITDKLLLDNEYKKSKVFCLTSLSEGFPIVFPEALKNGCFIISSDLPAAKDITGNMKYGALFDIGDVKQLSELLVTFCNDQDKLSRLCIIEQKFAYRNFYWPKICKKINLFLK